MKLHHKMTYAERGLRQCLMFVIIFQVVMTSHHFGKRKKFRDHTNMVIAEERKFRSTIWGFWSEWSDCSRTCGWGSSYSIRKCNIGYEKWCHVEFTRKYRTCNNQNCRQNSPDFREQQCSVYNEAPHKGRLHKWLPVKKRESNAANECVLLCRAADDESLIVQWADKVLDGTRCSDDSTNMCIAGRCQIVGCDNVLHSSASYDICGVCDGDGSSCKLVTGLYLPTQNHVEPEHSFVFPPKSRHILLNMKGKGNIGLHIDNASTDFLASRLQKSVISTLSGIRFEHGITVHNKKFVNIKGPLHSEAHVEIRNISDLKYVRYEYYRPLFYSWTFSRSRSTCSVSCGKGLLYIEPQCTSMDSMRKVDEMKCLSEDLQNPEPKVEHCNMHDCESSFVGKRIPLTFEYVEHHYRWSLDPWTECSKSCAGGSQSRIVSCVTETLDGDITQEKESRCLGHGNPAKPSIWQRCNEQACPVWATMPWSPCSATCAMGDQFRIVRCQLKDGSPAFNCEEEKKPKRTRKCLAKQSCYEPTEPTIIKIISSPARMFSENAAYVENDIVSISTEPSWVSEPWGSCSASCGSGIVSRKVKCQVYLEFIGTVEDLGEEKCESEKPITEKTCSFGPCPKKSRLILPARRTEEIRDFSHYAEYYGQEQIDEYAGWEEYDDETDEQQDDYRNYEWRYGEFGLCAPACGKGVKQSNQICFNIMTGSRSADDRCDPRLRESPIVQKCSDGPCILPSNGSPFGWEISPYGECSSECGRGVQTRSVKCRRLPEGIPTSRAGDSMRLPDLMCPSPKPLTTRVCSLIGCAPEWSPGPWSECSRTCSRGVQLRESRCTQRLSTGVTEQVPEEHCPRIRPIHKRKCAVVDCPPRYVVRKWTECSVTCGNGIQLRDVMCMRIPAGGNRVEQVPLHNCLQLSMPVLKRSCKQRKCPVSQSSRRVGSNHARIITEKRSYVQRPKETKVRLVVGMDAHVFLGSTVIMRCPVIRFKKSLIYWRFNGSEVEENDTHRTLSADNSLRVRHMLSTDTGRYTCVAGEVEADLVLNLIRNDEVQHNRRTNTHPEDDLSPGPGNTDNGVYNGIVNLNQDPFETSLHVRAYNELDQTHFAAIRTSEISPVTGVELERSPTAKIRPQTGFGESGARSPKPLTVLAEGLDTTWKTIRHGINEEHGISETNTGSSSTNSGNPERELFLLFEAAGINKSSEQVHDILSSLNIPSEEKNIVEILQSPVDIPNNPIKLDQNPYANSDTGDILKNGRSEHLGIVSVPQLQLEPDNPDRRSITINRPSQIGIVEIPAEGPLDDFAHPKILSQPTETPMQPGKDIVAYVGGTIVISDSESITLLCEASGYPIPRIEWFQGDRPIIYSDRRFVLLDHSLRILQPTRRDGGLYTCKATNVIGSDSASTRLNVAMKPHIISTSTDRFDIDSSIVEVPLGSIITSRLGATVRISCPVEGFPEPYVKWNKDVTGLRDNMRILPDNTLEIQPTTRQDQGLYACEASNPVGTDYQVSALVLIEPPHLANEVDLMNELEANGLLGIPELMMTSPYTTQYKVKMESTVMLGCPTTGFPEPKITWTFNGRPLHEFSQQLEFQLLIHNKVLQIPVVDAGSSGTYSCHASNRGGNHTTSLRLQLIEYSYIHDDLTKCSASCGGKGTQKTTYVCVEDGEHRVDEWFCIHAHKPGPKVLPCNRISCPPSFHTGPWTPCSKTCGSGTITRSVTCRMVMSDDTWRNLHNSACFRQLQNNSQITSNNQPSTEYVTNKPAEQDSCIIETCPTWKTGPWSQCSRKCVGRGSTVRIRRLQCVNMNGTKVPKSDCEKSEKPQRRELCRTSRCEPIWVASRWSMCSRSCGSDGIQTRILNCVFRGNKRQRAGSLCSRSDRPLVTATCNRIKCQNGHQTSSPLSQAKCVDKSGYCAGAKSAGLCPFYKYLCCKTCR